MAFCWFCTISFTNNKLIVYWAIKLAANGKSIKIYTIIMQCKYTDIPLCPSPRNRFDSINNDDDCVHMRGKKNERQNKVKDNRRTRTTSGLIDHSIVRGPRTIEYKSPKLIYRYNGSATNNNNNSVGFVCFRFVKTRAHTHMILVCALLLPLRFSICYEICHISKNQQHNDTTKPKWQNKKQKFDVKLYLLLSGKLKRSPNVLCFVSMKPNI